MTALADAPVNTLAPVVLPRCADCRIAVYASEISARPTAVYPVFPQLAGNSAPFDIDSKQFDSAPILYKAFRPETHWTMLESGRNVPSGRPAENAQQERLPGLF